MSTASRVADTGTDIDVARAFYTRLHHAREVVLDPVPDARFAYRFQAIGDDRLRLRSSVVAARRRGVLEPERAYILTWSPTGGVVLDAGTPDELHLEPGMPVMWPTGRPFASDAAPGVTLHALDFGAEYLEALSAERTGSAPGPLRFDVVPDRAALHRLRAMLTGSRAVLLDPAAGAESRAAVTRLLACGVLEAFRGRSGDDAAAAPDRPEPSAVMRALDFVDASLRTPVTTGDVAAAAGISIRGLQQAFARADQESPMTVLRNRRLGRVRADLLVADPAAVTVSEVARSYQFHHLGRFAAQYHALFGEYPSSTLRA